ncbi:arginase family protein [Dyella ginsengisoli]|uniref:arginase family protein n=1 Tax=Dyella ginsengisoli TaxID=363848 RepID=UPI0003471664|nr:arginase family protein [Dyella ginsengisoli]
MTRPIVLDIDRSVGPLPQRLVIPLEHWQESLRFGCSLRTMERFRGVLDDTLPVAHGTVMLGSGDFHHLTWPLVERVRAAAPFQVVVLDNHPDNMRYPFGVHCGSWVRRVAMLPTVSHVHVVGIGSSDIGAGHAWENYRTPLREGRLSYWSVGVDVGWAARAGLAHAFHAFDDADALVRAFADEQLVAPQPAYLSIDKDVFAADVARTNWDQGHFQLAHAIAVIDSLRAGGLVGSDITGEISAYRYKSWWKRRLAAIDDQPVVDARELAGWQAQQHALNVELLRAIAGAAAP